MATFEEAVESGLGDWSIAGFRWPNDEDVAVLLASPDDSRLVEVIFRWVTELKITMDYGGYSGRPLIFNVILQRSDNRQYCEVILGAQPDGTIVFEYDSSTLREIE